MPIHQDPASGSLFAPRQFHRSFSSSYQPSANFSSANYPANPIYAYDDTGVHAGCREIGGKMERKKNGEKEEEEVGWKDVGSDFLSENRES